MTAGPRFSILMPTRNRARLLRFALQSALELRGDDFEIVVSDNCSSDETPEVIRELTDSRVRSVRTPRSLPMAESMEFVFGHARGEHVTLLNDDDALTAGTLETARAIIDATQASLVVWPYCHYFYPDWPEVRNRNTLVAWSRSGRVEELRASDTLAMAYGRLDTYRLPTFANAVCHRSLIERAGRRVPRLFQALGWDVFAGPLVLVEAGTYQWVDRPFTLLGRWPKSLGASLATGQSDRVEAHRLELSEERLLRSVPVKAMTPINVVAEALLQAKVALGTELAELQLDWPRYFARIYQDLLYLESHGADVAELLLRFRMAMQAQPPPVTTAATAAVRDLEGSRPWARRRLRRLINRLPWLGWLERAVRSEPKSEDGAFVLSGDSAGFTGILECARVWDRLLGQPPDMRGLGPDATWEHRERPTRANPGGPEASGAGERSIELPG